MREDVWGDIVFECTPLEGFPIEIPKEVFTLLVGWMVVVIRVLVYVGIKMAIAEEGIEVPP